MSMQAQAERERQARVILGDSERQVAEKFGEAARTYANDPTALHLRAMNMFYEGLKHNATIVIIPSTVVETMQFGTVAGLTALTKGLGDEVANKGEQATLPGLVSLWCFETVKGKYHSSGGPDRVVGSRGSASPRQGGA